MDADLPELELQQQLQRFTTRFLDRITQASETLERASRPAVRDEALRKNLLYVSSAMEIATGPISEVNLLDMLVFLRLSRTVLENHWIPEVYGGEGGDLASVFKRSEQELSTVAAQVLSNAQRDQLTRLVDAWLADNPDQIRVEGVRLADFSSAAGSAAAERAKQTKGLLAGMKTATRAANQALLLTERGLFLFHRLPFLWRLQARLGAREMLGDAVAQLSDGAQAPIANVTRKARQLASGAVIYAGFLGGAGMLLWWLGSSFRRR